MDGTAGASGPNARGAPGPSTAAARSQTSGSKARCGPLPPGRTEPAGTGGTGWRSAREVERVCQAIPRRVLRVAAGRAEVEVDGRPQWVITPGLPDLAVGEYVVVHAGAALERLAREDAEEILRFYAGLEELLAESASAAESGNRGDRSP